MILSKVLWNKFNDKFGKSILHPQYYLKNFEYQAIIELKKKAKGTLVDIGCGRQAYKKYLLGSVDQYIGVDHPETAKMYQDGEKPDFFADAQDLPFKNNFCETASMISVLEHIPNPGKAISEAYRILKPGGYFVLITVQSYPLHDAPYDYYRYTQYGLKTLFKESGFTKVTTKPLGSYPIFAGQMLNVYLLNKLKKGLNGSNFSKLLSILFTVPVFLISIVINLKVYVISRLVSDYQDGSFALYNLVVAKK